MVTSWVFIVYKKKCLRTISQIVEKLCHQRKFCARSWKELARNILDLRSILQDQERLHREQCKSKLVSLSTFRHPNNLPYQQSSNSTNSQIMVLNSSYRPNIFFYLPSFFFTAIQYWTLYIPPNQFWTTIYSLKYIILKATMSWLYCNWYSVVDILTYTYII